MSRYGASVETVRRAAILARSDANPYGVLDLLADHKEALRE